MRHHAGYDKSQCVPVIFITAASNVEERVLSGLATLAAVDYIGKPFQREELLARVRTHLELSRLRDNLERQVSDRTAELRSTGLIQLRESEQRFRNMADTAQPVMIWVSDTDKLRTFFNRTWLTFTGRSMEEEHGAGWRKGVHPHDLERYLGIYTSAFDGRRDFQIEYLLRRADGEYRVGAKQWDPTFCAQWRFRRVILALLSISRTSNEFSRRRSPGRSLSPWFL